MDCFFSTCVMFLTMAVHLDVVQLAFQHPASNVQNMWSCYTDLTLQAGQKNILIHGPKMDNKGKNDFTQKKNLNNTGFLALAMTSSWTISHTKRWNELPQVQNYRWTHSPPQNSLQVYHSCVWCLTCPAMQVQNTQKFCYWKYKARCDLC